jgi:tRNA modification GTPase
VLDASEPLTGADDKFLSEFANKKRILVVNKMDLPRRLKLPEAVGLAVPGESEVPQPKRHDRDIAPYRSVVDVCCLSGQGIEALKDAIKELVWSGEIKAEMLQVMINSRHQDALNRARAATQRTIDALRGDVTLELAALDLRIAVNAVGEIVGKTATEDLLDSIFSQFCIGK